MEKCARYGQVIALDTAHIPEKIKCEQKCHILSPKKEEE